MSSRSSQGRTTKSTEGASVPDRMHAVMTPYVESGAVPGLAWWVSRDGDVSRGELGTSHPGGAGDPVTPDTPFRISSTTKPITAVVAMTLVDDGTLSLDDPVDRWLPELADRRVVVDPEGDITHTVPANRPILVRDVLEFRLGLGYDFSGAPTPVLDALERAGVHMGAPAPQANPDPDTWMSTFAPFPLMYQPGERWLYNIGAEVLGVLVARASGSTLPDLMRERVLEPLGMRSTAFSVAAERERRAGGWGRCGLPVRTVVTSRSTTRPTGSGADRRRSPTAPTGWCRPWTTWRRSGP